MNLVMYKGYPDKVGRRQIFAGSGVGPTSYSQTTGDPITVPQFQNYIDAVHMSQSVSGTYYARVQPSGAGPRQTWKAKYYVVATNAEVANAVNLSAETFIVSGFGGTY
jgi:hypothetical protein